MILAFFWALLAELSLAEPNTWVLWTDLDGADFFWTSSNCSTTVVPDSSIVDNTPAVAPSNGGISDMIFFPDTHEILWLEGGYLLRSWIDKTERRQLCQLPGDANASELENGNGTGAALGLHGEAGALAWTSKELTAVMFFASKMTKKLWVATLTSIPPRDASHVGTWIEVLGASVATSGASGAAKPVLMAREGTVYWTDGESSSFRSLDVPSALAGTATTATTLAQLGEGAWGEVTVAEATNDGRFLWIRQAAAETQFRLELILSLDALQEGPSSNYATGNVRTLYSFLEGDQPSALAVQPAPSSGLPYRGNITQLYQQVYWSVSAPDTQARIDHLNLDTGQVSTLTYALGLERRGAAPARPSALSVYPMPTVCVNVGCLYLRVWEECRICTVDQCDTCFLDTQDWVVKQWYASHGLFSNCLWLFPPKQGAWFVRNEVQQAKDEGLLPDDFVAQELPPDGATPVGEAVATVPPTRTATTATITSTVSSSSFTETSTTSTSLTLSSTNPCVAVEVLDEGVVSDQSCSSMLDAWCQEVSDSDNRSMLAPQSLRRDCATYFWSFKELCASSSAAPQSDSCSYPLWSYVLFAAGLALMLAVLVPFCCYAMRRAQPSGCSGHRSHRGTGTISGLRHAALEKDVGGPGPVEDCQSHWCCRHYWTRYLRRKRSRKDPSENEASKVNLSEYDGNGSERRKSWETFGLHDVDAVRSSRSEPSIGSPRGADESVSGGLQQIFKGTWQPGLSSSSAALAAGRLTNAMQKFMSSNTRQGDKWRLLHDVEDILRTLGSALPGNLRSTAWAWHARQSGRLHRSDALQAAEEEAKSIAEDFREDLSSRLQSGVRLLELAELEGAESFNETGPTRAVSPVSPAGAARGLKALKLQISFDQLKTRIEELGPSRKNLITAGHLLDGYESLLRLSEELHSAQAARAAGAEDSDEMDRLVKEMKQLQEALEEELKGSGLPPGAWQATFDRFTQRNKRQVEKQSHAWLKGLKEAAARAARFGHALKGSKGKGRLSEMEKTLMEELTSCEAAAKAGDSEEQSTSWKQLQRVWTQLQDQLDQVRKLQKLPGAGDGAEGGRLSSWAMSRSKLMHRSQTQPLQMKDLSPELSVSAAELQVLQEEVVTFRQKIRGAATGEDGHGRTPLLMAGRQHLQQQEVEKLLRSAKAGSHHSAALVDDDALAAGQEVSAQWQQLLSELEDLQADLAEPGPQRPGTSGRLSLGIGSRLSPKRGPKKASTSSSKSSGSLPLDLLEASSAFLRHSEELARIRSQESEDGSNPMLTLGQSIYTQQALESMELEVAKALQDAEAKRGDSEDWRSMQQLLQELHAGIKEAKTQAAAQEQSWQSFILPGQSSEVELITEETQEREAPWQEPNKDNKVRGNRSGAVHGRLSSAEQQDLQQFLQTLQQSLKGDDLSVAARKLSSICEKWATKDTAARSGDANIRQAWSVDEQGASDGEGEDLAESLWPLLARLSSKERDALLSKMADLQRQVQAGDGDINSLKKRLEEICRFQLGLDCPGPESHLDDRLNPQDFAVAIAAAQKRMACLEEQLELQREGLQRQRRKSVQAPMVLAGHSLLHGSLLKAASKEHDQCRAECDRLQALDGGMTQQLSVQSTQLRQLLKGCEDSSWHLSQGLLQVADGDATASALLSALGKEPSSTAHLSAALQRLATLDDQLQQHKAALGARGRRRHGGLDDALLTQFLQEKSDALSLLKDTAKDLLDEDSSRQVYDGWQSQLTSALEHVVATGDAYGTDEDGSPSQRIPGSPSTALAGSLEEARGRLAALEAARAAGARRPRLKAGSTFAEHDPAWWQQLSEETEDDGIDPQSLQERLRRHHEILQQWRRDMEHAEHAEQGLPMLAAKLAMHDRVLTEMLKNGALQGPIEAEDQELLRACKDAAQILSREILEASDSDATAALLTADGLGETRDREPDLDAALGRLGAWAKRLEGVRQVVVRRGAADNALLTTLAAERADLLQWMEDHLGDSPALRPLRALLAEGSRELEMMAGAADVADPTDGDSLEKFGTKKKTFSDDDLLSELEEANRRLGRFDAELEKQRKALQRRRKKGLEAAVDPDVLASLVQERAALVDWAEDRLKTTADPSLSAFRQHCRRAARGLEQLVMEDLSSDPSLVDPTALLAEARRRLLMLEEEGNQRLRRRQRVLPGAAAGEELGDQDPLGTFGTKKSRFDDHDWQSDLEEARRRLARFEQQLEEQRNGLQRRRKKGEDASVPEEILTSLVSERADLVEWAEDRLKTTEDPSLSAFRQQCRAAARGLEQLVMEDLSSDPSSVDPTALLAEARRRLILMEEEASKQRLKRRPRGAASKAGTTSRATASSRLKVVQDEDPQVLIADAARRLARLEAELESQRQGLCRRRLQPKTEAAEVQAAHALMHESAIEGLKDQRAKCRADCDRLLRAATADTTWSPEQRAACNELQEKCAELEEEWKSCAETAELLKEEVAEAMPSRLTAMLRRNDSQAEASEALLEAMRRVASFDHELEQQRTMMQRRRKAAQKDPGSTVGEDAMLMALLEEKRQAVAHCEEMAQEDEAWEDVHQLWQGVLTSSLLELAAELPQKTQVQRGTISAAEKNQALAEAQRRLDRLDEESERQRLGLKRRRKGAEEAGRGRRELEKLVETGTEFEHLATEHREGLNHQQNNIKEVMASDVEPLEEIEHWRQLVGLEELQAAAGKMSEQLATIEAEEIDEIAVEREKRQKPQDDAVSAAERSAAKQQCQEMQLRLEEMRQDEEERQRLLMQRRQRKVKEPPEHAEKAARITEENSRDLLLKAYECITEGNPGDVQVLRQQLQDLRADAFSESKEEPQGAAESDTQKPAKAAKPKAARPPPKEELEAALAASTERMDLVKSLGADLLSQLEVVFSSQEDRGDLASAVMNVVERWRGQLPQSHEASVPSDMYMEHMGAACEDAVKAVTDESDVNARRAFMAAYRERMASVSQATQVQAEREEEGLRARAAARRQRRAQQREAESPSKPTSTSPSRFSRKSALARQSTVAFTTEAEVQNLRKTGENFARSFFLQTEEEDEEQARRMVRRLESRSKSRSRPGTAAASPETSPLRRGLTQSLSMTASSWAFSPSGNRSEGGTNLA